MAVTAALVKELRELTGSGMMDCKKALVETDGDIDKAVDWLREKGIMKAQKKSGRIAAEALVKGDLDMDVFLEEPFQGSTVKEVLTAKVAKIGENLNIRRYTRVEEDGVVYTGYIHGGGRIGVVIGIKTDATPAEVEACGRDVAMQVASMNPKFVDEDGVDPEYIENEKKILTEQVLNEGKKPEMVEKIVAGKIKKELKEVCLVDQPFVKDSDLSVGQYVEKCAKEIGKDMKVVSMVRFEVGEGIEKKEDDFAAEVAAAVQG